MPKKQDGRSKSVTLIRSRHSEGSRTAKVTTTFRTDAKAMSKLQAQLDKKYGDQVFTTIADGSRAGNIDAVPSGWQELDDLITGETDKDARTIPGSGLGWPRGRIIEIFGNEGQGKTTLALHIISAFQRMGATCAFVDAEHALDVTYAAKLGVDLTTLKLSQPGHGGEATLALVTNMCESGLFGAIVVDSVAALTPLAELENDLDEPIQPASQARMMSRALRKLTSVVSRHGTLLVFINQMRMKIGVRFGNPNTTTGGNALKFYASVRFEMTNVKTQKKGDRVVHRRTRIRAVKNKVAPPFRDVYADIAPNRGIIAVHGDPGLGSSSDSDD